MTKELAHVEDEDGNVVKDEDGNVVIDKPSKDAYEGVRKALDDKEYDAVRLVLAKSGEGVLASYNFTI